MVKGREPRSCCKEQAGEIASPKTQESRWTGVVRAVYPILESNGPV